MSDNNGPEQTRFDTERNLRCVISDLKAENTALIARATAAEKIAKDCEPYLKEHETPAMCIARNRTDVDIALNMVVQLKAELTTLREAAESEHIRIDEVRRQWEQKCIALAKELSALREAARHSE